MKNPDWWLCLVWLNFNLVSTLSLSVANKKSSYSSSGRDSLGSNCNKTNSHVLDYLRQSTNTTSYSSPGLDSLECHHNVDLLADKCRHCRSARKKENSWKWMNLMSSWNVNFDFSLVCILLLRKVFLRSITLALLWLFGAIMKFHRHRFEQLLTFFNITFFIYNFFLSLAWRPRKNDCMLQICQCPKKIRSCSFSSYKFILVH